MVKDLDILMDKTIDFKLNGDLIKVNQLSYKMVRKLDAINKIENEEEKLDKQMLFIVEILNNNTSCKKFKNTDIEKLPFPVITKILEDVAKSIYGIESNPN